MFPTHRFISILSALGLPVLLALTACGTRYPLGIPEDQWLVMSTEQRLQAQQTQSKQDRAAEERRAADARAREVEAARQQAELEWRRSQARYGERVQCILSDAQTRLGGKMRSIEPVALDVVQGAFTEVDLSEPAGQTMRFRTTVFAHFDGQTLSICPGASDDPIRAGTCIRLLGTIADYRRGLDQHIGEGNFLRGRLRCDLMPPQGLYQTKP